MYFCFDIKQISYFQTQLLSSLKSFDPRREKNLLFAYVKTKKQISFAVTAKLISTFVFATRIVQSLYFLNPKFQGSSHLLWLYSLICVGPGRKPRRPVFSQRGSFIFQVCAIIGGTFTVAGILDSLIFSAAEIVKKVQLGKLS